MIVQCDACSTKFKLDDSKIKDTGVRVRCTKCQNVFTVMPPSPPSQEAPPKEEQAFEVSFETKAQAPPPPPPPAEEKGVGGLGQETFQAKTEEKKPESSSWAVDFSFEEKPGEKEKKSDWDLGIEFPSTKQEAPPAEKKEEKFTFETTQEPTVTFEATKEAPPAVETSKFTFDEGFAPPLEKTTFEIEAPPKEEEFVVPSAKEEAKTVVMQAPIPAAPSREELFEVGGGVAKETAFEAGGEKKSKKGIFIAVAIIVLLAAGGTALYFTQGPAFVSQLFSRGTQQNKFFDLMSLRGYYVSNPNAGRLFIIEGKLVNNVDEPKEVSGVHGILFDEKGKKVKDAWVAPGRIITQDELKTISVAELEKRFKDRKGMIPAKGTVPFMIVFHGISQELSEFTVEVGP